MVRTHCETIKGYDELGRPILKNKLKYKSHDKAVKACKNMNLRKGQVIKLVTYKCTVCYEYHIGRNGTEITPKYRNKLLKEEIIKFAPKKISLKIIGKIDL